MNQQNKFLLNYSAISNVPLHVYDKDFVFIVNGQEFKTSKLVADLLSPKICQNHTIDPTLDKFIIFTKQEGDFSNILNLVTFNEISFQTNELLFIAEVIEILGNKSIEMNSQEELTEITEENVFSELEIHQKFSKFYSKRLSDEIEFISSHFFKFCDSKKDELKKISIETLINIIKNSKLKIESEDQFLQFVNEFYSYDTKYSILYEYVQFNHVTSQTMIKFIDVYDINDITNQAWKKLAERLIEETKQQKSLNDQTFSPNVNQQFDGIINYLVKQTNGNIDKEINFTASSIGSSDINSFGPQCVSIFNDRNKIFHSNGNQNEWICFNFKNHQVIPTHYTLRSVDSRGDVNGYHLKSWVVEGSNDNSNWDNLDEQKDCNFLNGKGKIHTFKIEKETMKEYKYIRIKMTGNNWTGSNFFIIDSIEIYGTLI